ncbi:MAG: MBL fold metallo-hydrolase [Deltaproteobacteria bacterium]|nr:MBL fold metallo-hydrolase [Deltaproteobacteria bacterium]
MRQLLALSALVGLALAPVTARAGDLRIYYFDVGQGDAALIVSPSGRTVLIDAGPPESSSRLRARLEQLLPGPIDLAILTHAHSDHLGGMQEALGVHGARLFVDSGFDHPSPSDDALIKYIQAHGLQMQNARAGKVFDLGGGAQLQLLAPAQPFLSGTASDANANSVVARLTFGKHAFLFAGDAEAETEAVLLKSGQTLRADVLKVAHHGARGGTTAQFLSAVKPDYAVISAGAGNAIEAPARSVIDRLDAVKAQVFRTDLDGEVRVISDGHTLQIHGGGETPLTTALAEMPAPPTLHLHDVQKQVKEKSGKKGHEKAEAAVPIERVADAQPAQVHPDVGGGSKGGHYVASQRSDVFHLASCTWAKKIKPENLVTFGTRQEAIASGRRPASCCNP